MSYLEWIAMISSLLYLIFAIKNNSIGFLFAIISGGIWTYVTYYSYGLFYDAIIQVFYVIMAIYGIYRWNKGNDETIDTPITIFSWKVHIAFIISGFFMTNILSNISSSMEGVNYAGLDAFTTVFLIIGTLLLVERKLYSWWYLVIADLVYIYIYGQSGAWLFMGTMVVYSVFGMVGFYNWNKLYDNNFKGRNI